MSDEEQQTVTKPAHKEQRQSVWYAVWTVLFLILFGIFGVAGVTKWMQLNQQIQVLKKNQIEEATQRDAQLQPIQNKITELANVQTQLTTDLSDQKTQLSAWQAAATGNIDRWYVAEARYLVKLAQYEADISVNTLLISGYLEKAQAVLQKVNDPKAIEMRVALKQDQDAVLAKAAVTDVGALFQKLVDLDKQIDELPFPLQAIMQPSSDVTPSNDSRVSSAVWWQQGLDKSWQLLKEMVVVKQNIDNRPPFLLPDDKRLLKANLHLQLQHAMDGLLRNQASIYTTSLQQASDWVSRYFNADSPAAVAWLKEVSQLQQADLSALSLDVSHAIPLFDAFL